MHPDPEELYKTTLRGLLGYFAVGFGLRHNVCLAFAQRAVIRQHKSFKDFHRRHVMKLCLCSVSPALASCMQLVVSWCPVRGQPRADTGVKRSMNFDANFGPGGAMHSLRAPTRYGPPSQRCPETYRFQLWRSHLHRATHSRECAPLLGF